MKPHPLEVLDCDGRAERRHRFSSVFRLPKAAWRFASRRSPKGLLAGPAALGISLSLCGSPLFAASPADAPELLSVKKIWDAAPHNAFTDLTRFGEKWFCTFRESQGHVGGNGKIRVLTSADGERWESAALLGEDGIDLRDPKFSTTPDGRFMLVLGGSVYEGKVLKERQPRVAFSKDGCQWTAPRRVLDKGDWLWRVTWHKGRAYGITYGSDWGIRLVESSDGTAWHLLAKLDVPGRPNEATLRFLPNDTGVALVRREALDQEAWIGQSPPPYTNWTWRPAGMQIGGPNFLVLPSGSMVASGRQYNAKPGANRTFVGSMTPKGVKAELVLPSGGDCSYAGMVWHEDLLWTSYYSTHEGKTAIYLAKIRLPGQKP